MVPDLPYEKGLLILNMFGEPEKSQFFGLCRAQHKHNFCTISDYAEFSNKY
jgi:hypothetical protein